MTPMGECASNARGRTAPSLLALAALALLLAAGGCGGGSPGGVAGEANGTPAAGGASARDRQGSGGFAHGGGSASSKGEGGAGRNGAAGGSGQAKTGGEKSIEDFGAEAAGAERGAVLSSFHGYLRALGDRDYAAACSRLARTAHQGIAQLAPPGLRSNGCAAALSHLLAPTAAAIARSQASGRVTRVRVRGARGFVVFHAPGARLYQMPIVREGGRWKVGLVAASILVPSAATLGQ